MSDASSAAVAAEGVTPDRPVEVVMGRVYSIHPDNAGGRKPPEPVITFRFWRGGTDGLEFAVRDISVPVAHPVHRNVEWLSYTEGFIRSADIGHKLVPFLEGRPIHEQLDGANVDFLGRYVFLHRTKGELENQIFGDARISVDEMVARLESMYKQVRENITEILRNSSDVPEDVQKTFGLYVAPVIPIEAVPTPPVIAMADVGHDFDANGTHTEGRHDPEPAATETVTTETVNHGTV